MKNPRNIALALAALLPTAYWISTLFVSAETLIRHEIAEMVAGFNTPDVGDATAALRDDFEMLTSGGRRLASKVEVQGYLRGFVLTWRDPTTRRFAMSLEVPDEQTQVEIDDDQQSAEVRLLARLSSTRKKTRSVWEISVVARFENGDDGWQVVSASHQTIDGKRPF